jgi:hypothetical protein
VPVRLGFEVAERQILQLPLQLPHTQPVRQRREHRARLSRESLALIGRKLACVTESHELLREVREHESRVTDNGEQHLADGLGLARVEPLRGRPVARQSDIAQPLQVHRNLRRGRGRDVAELFGRETVTPEHGP